MVDWLYRLSAAALVVPGVRSSFDLLSHRNHGTGVPGIKVKMLFFIYQDHPSHRAHHSETGPDAQTKLIWMSTSLLE